MSEKIAELKSDIAELEQLLLQCKRPKVKDLLTLDLRKITTELIKLQEQEVKSTMECSPSVPSAPIDVTRKSYQVKLQNYAWDQTNQYVKFYVTLSNVHTLTAENITCSFTNKSFELLVKGLENKDYILLITKLLNNIDPAKSSWKIKTDMVVVSAAKCESTNWAYVTEIEKKAKDGKKMVPDKMDKSTDPSESLMSMMRNMYEQGDDDLKRTIAKAWTESQQKNKSGGDML